MNQRMYMNLLNEAKEQGIHRYVVGAVIIRDSKILLLRKPETEFMGGMYELPSGRVENKEPLDVALYREVEEETGLRIKRIKRYIGHFDYSKNGQKTRQFNFIVEVQSPIEIRLQEHDSYDWVYKDKLNRYSVTDEVKNTIGDSNE